MQDLKNYSTPTSDTKIFLTNRGDQEIKLYIAKLCRKNHVAFDDDELDVLLLGRETCAELYLPYGVKSLKVGYNGENVDLDLFFDIYKTKIGSLDRKSYTKAITEEEELKVFAKFPIVKPIRDCDD